MKDYRNLLKACATNSDRSSHIKKIVRSLSGVLFVTPLVCAYSATVAIRASSAQDYRLILPDHSQSIEISQSTTNTQTSETTAFLESIDTFFRPPSNPRPSSETTITKGTRSGRCLGRERSLDLLGPDQKTGQTTKARPEFAWHLPSVEGSFPVIFRLFEVREDGSINRIYMDELPYMAGYNSYQLPLEAPALTTDREYQWQVIVNCEPNRPSRAIAQALSIERVSPSATLSQALSTATTAEERAIAYGQAGLWYDAIAQVAQAETDREIATRDSLLSHLSDLAISQE